MARDVGIEPTRPFDHRLSRPAQKWPIIIKEDPEMLLSDFKAFCMVDLQLTEETAKNHRAKTRRFLKWLAVNRDELNQNTIRDYLTQFNGSNPNTYANVLKSLKVFVRDFLKNPSLVESFKFPTIPFKPKTIPSKCEINKFYNALDTWKDKTLFLVYATSGLRRQEALNLTIDELSFENCMIKPKPHNGKTKHTWLTFFNSECLEVIKQYLSERTDNNTKLFPMSRLDEENLWQTAIIKTGIRITPQMLREFFCSELGSNGVQDRYVDAFCGRLPKSVLAKHYSDFSGDKLKDIYEKAGLNILS
jgi:site-specific recombinase XerD